MTEQEKLRCPNERPLYLYIQGHTKHNVDCMYCMLAHFLLMSLVKCIFNRFLMCF